MSNYLCNGKTLTLNPNNIIGVGGEADIFKLGGGEAVKIWKPPTHVDFQGMPVEQQAAKDRIKEHQQKMRALPRGLPNRVVTPLALVTDPTGKIVQGYKMKFLKGMELLMRYADRNFRNQGISNDDVALIFRDLHKTFNDIHKAQVVIGDCNDLNIMVQGHEAYLIDMDSWQWANFHTRVFTAKFVDPTRCEKDNLMLVQPHNADSDWYAYAVMLFNSLLFVDPYGGIYKPKDPKNKLSPSQRPLHRVTVFNPEVKYPKPATPFTVLPDDLLTFFQETFEKDKRGEFPVRILENMRWTKCSACGTEHARAKCPQCMAVSPHQVKQVIVKQGKVTATRIFKTRGYILYAAFQDNDLRYLYHEDNKFTREGDNVIVKGPLDPKMRFRLQGDLTHIGRNQLVTSVIKAGMNVGHAPLAQTVDYFGTLPVFDANREHFYWLENGVLYRNGAFRPERIGDVLRNQTLFWVGPQFGFGFYRAGNISQAFIFDAKKHSFNDNVELPQIRGQLMDSTCVFGTDCCWFMLSTKEQGKTINQCFLYNRNGTIIADAKLDVSDDGSWLSSIRGRMATADFLLAATDEGLVRIRANGTMLEVDTQWPDTEPFLDSRSNLFPAPGGIHVVDQHEIRVLKLS